MRLQKFVVALAIVSIVVAGCAGVTEEGAASGMEVTNWAIGGSGSGSGPYVMAGIISNVVTNRSERLQISPQVTAGFEDNVKLLNEKSLEIGITDGPTLRKLHDNCHDLRGVFNIQTNYIHIVARAGLGIEKIEDLGGRKINIGAPGMGTRVVSEPLLNAYGLTTEDYEVSALTTGDAIDALKNDQIDAALIISGLPHSGISELAVLKNIILLPIEGPIADTHAVEQSLISVTIPGGTYRSENRDVTSLGVILKFCVHKDLEEDLVYEFTKSVWDNLDDIKQTHDSVKDTELDNIAIEGWGNVLLHPGAERYFKEVRLIN